MQNVEDLVDVGRYHVACMTNFYIEHDTKIVGRPASIETKNFLEYITNYIEIYPSDSQISVNDLFAEYSQSDCCPAFSTIKKHLTLRFGDKLLYHEYQNDMIIMIKKNLLNYLKLGIIKSGKKIQTKSALE